ncbi:cupin domain-containing protein [Prosthecochloris sp. N3]|uniref:Cupin domain-containing protein n=1 Tax=Prosthecochloris ethylica TaxID=2743976 RepID=A0ABR9XQI2_9CHLB|nr:MULTISPECIES: cupin domain-containing protein [Prosthecochloris]MEC9486758.1 cupin domain-containing protein [Prosthecochloris sp.]MBF0585502.1 cupin domain-containing protein [Prosthecochloris ethylica]MBF0636288.1 cupin domain-containing protein [Prosthecochloris ethylica]NUK46732.1 cupin domain-containing protein [Prosthecochloris ethylica]RNA64686.1 cupin domain-containing protein [Prosthecochloris sp. ZM_2]
MICNVLNSLPGDRSREVTDLLAGSEHVRIERIVSHGHSSPETGWYDQEETEWVLVLEGWGELEFENGDRVMMRAGDALTIGAHSRHRVLGTRPDGPTVWIAVFYR